MDKNRQILITILIFLTLSLVLSIIKISLTLNEREQEFSLAISGTAPGIGVIKIYGPISTEGSGGAFSVAGSSDTIVSELDKLQSDKKIKAIVLRINSPGGTVSATQEIFQKIMSVRQNNIPVIASMGDVAASGGFYIASACNYILANQGTLTGSIGVIISAPSFKELFDKYGIKMNVIKSGEYKDTLSMARELEDNERQLLQDVIDSTYMQFLKDISLGRNMPIDDFRKYADGRIFTGSQAFEYKLVDKVGSYTDAIKEAKRLAKLPENAPVYQLEPGPFDQLLGSLNAKLGTKSKLPIPAFSESLTLIEYRYQP